MTALHVVVRPRPETSPDPALASLHGVLDIVVEGVNLTARVGSGQALDFLTELAFALATASVSPCQRATVPLHAGSEVWELGLECDGLDVLISVFCPGPVPSVAAHDRKVGASALRRAITDGVERALVERGPLPAPVRLGLTSARDALAKLPSKPRAKVVSREAASVKSKAGRLSAVATVVLRKADRSAMLSATQLERADLLSLLAVGDLTLKSGATILVKGSSHVFLDAERLLGLAECASESWRSARPTFRRAQLTEVKVSLRRGPGEAQLEMSFSCSRGPSAGGGTRMHRLDCAEFVGLAIGFAENLSKAIRQLDPTQEHNLRLRNLEQRGRALAAQIEVPGEEESVPNPRPDSYRRYVPRMRRSVGIWETGPKMRFMPRWVATIPNIDLRSTFLCGDRLMVGGAHETACLKRSNGEMLWKRATLPAACVVTPAGLIRIEADGRLSCHHLDDGEVRFSLTVAPRTRRGAFGSVMYGSGMPKLLALVEADHQVTGIDLLGGSVRWRYSAKRPGNYRLRRAGRLLLVSGGDPLMVALDGVNGEAVWSLRARLPFSGDITVDHDSAFTLSGAAGGRYMLHRFNPWSGKAEWQVELDERPLPGRPPLLTETAVIVPTVEEEGCGVLAFDRATGQKLWEHAPGLVSATSAWLAVDDVIVANSASGMMLGLGADDGKARFNHVFSCSTDGDQPRRFEPVLRSGALFVPQHQVHVVRPRDGEILGTLPSDLIPDLIRVDERCDVYVGEESGHLAAFGAAPRLAIVR
jgi:outer membrane protein assembly factor BamB